MNSTPLRAADARIVVIGAGRLGTVLAGALRAAGLHADGPFGRHSVAAGAVPAADVALLCVPDAEIAPAARALRGRARLLGHVSGATPLDDVDFGIHPLQTVTGTETPEVFHGIGCAIAGRTAEAASLAEDLARLLGAHPFRIDDAQRSAYHAAASLSSNLVLTVLDAAERLAETAGIPAAEARTHLAPLVARSVENWTAQGASSALTGPIARGDEATVARQRAAIAAEAGDLLPLFDALCDATRILASAPRTTTADEGVLA